MEESETVLISFNKYVKYMQSVPWLPQFQQGTRNRWSAF